MDVSSSQLHTSLVQWLEHCLAMGGTLVFDASTLTDGLSIADCLLQLAPDFFTVDWRAKIIAETGGNWKLKHGNLKKILRAVLEYYDQVLHLSLEQFTFPDLAAIAEKASEEDMCCLLQLVLGIAINCKRKDTYIQAIMAMEQEVQHVVMGAIQHLMSLQSPSFVTGSEYKELEAEHRQAIEEVQTVKADKEQLLQTNHELHTQLRVTQAELSDIIKEMEGVKSQLSEAQATAGVSGEARVMQLLKQLEAVKTEKLKIEAERDELRHRTQELNTQVQELFLRNRELQAETDEIPILRDSLEEMKYTESKVKSYESVISQYKKKLEDAQEMRKILKAMEDKNMMYMQQTLDLEEELRRLSGLRIQLEAQKQKLQELEHNLAQEKLKSLEASQDAEEKGVLVDTLSGELNQVKRERDHLSMQVLVPSTPTSVQSAVFQFSETKLAGSPTIEQTDLGLAEAFTPELREKMVRLEKQNEILSRRLDSMSESPLSLGGSVGGDSTEQRVEKLERDVAEKSQQLRRMEKAIKEYRSQISSLEELRKHKDTEIDKYKKYLNKAKKIIESIGEGKPKAGEEGLEVQRLKMQLKEKERSNEKLDREYSQDRQAWEREEKLVVSAWYEMGLMMHRKHTQDRLLAQHNQSFLGQQRLALYKRPVPINTSAAKSSTPGDSKYV